MGGIADAEHGVVVAIVARRPTCAEPENIVCSGTLIAPRAVLTAAHCLQGREPDELEVLVGQDVAAPDAVLGVWSAAVHPGYDPLAAPEDANDLALLVLDREISIAPAMMASSLPSELVVGASVRLVGFGAIAPGGAVGWRLGADAVVDGVASRALSTGDVGVPCGGDSGGAMFAMTAGGERLVAVIKASGTGCMDAGLSTRVDSSFASFIEPSLAVAAATPAPDRPPFDPGTAYCAGACAAHADCPLGMLCLPDAGAMHCGYRDARVARFGEVCDGSEGGPCVPVGQGQARECRQLIAPCELGGGGDDDGGCAAAPDGAVGAAMALLVLVFAIRREAAHRRHASRR